MAENYGLNLSDYDSDKNGRIEGEELDSLLGDVKEQMRAADKTVTNGLTVVFLLVCAISAKSNYYAFMQTFAEEGKWLSMLWSALCVLVMDGSLSLLIYGVKRWFSTRLEKAVALLGIVALFVCMGIGMITHSMMRKHLALNGFQEAYLEWGAWVVLLGVAVVAVLLLLLHPFERLMRKEITVYGRQTETLINAKSEALRSHAVREALQTRMQTESQELAQRIAGNSHGSGGAPPRVATTAARRPRSTGVSASAPPVFLKAASEEVAHLSPKK